MLSQKEKLKKATIGIFWIYKSKIYLKSVKTNDIKPINGFRDSDFWHYKVWDEVSSQHICLYLYEYEEIPRGRVVHDVIHDTYIVYSNEDIINSDEAKNLIINGFNLIAKSVIFKYDSHYQVINPP